MICQLQCDSKQKEQLFRIPNIQQSPVFFLRKVEAKSLELFWQDFIEQVNSTNSYTLLKGPHFRIAKNWRNSCFVAKFLTKFALFDDRKMAFFAAKSFGA